jgi:hypothetical protein
VSRAERNRRLFVGGIRQRQTIVPDEHGEGARRTLYALQHCPSFLRIRIVSTEGQPASLQEIPNLM